MLEVIGVGFGRTGTLSLKRALEHLGYGPCYHFTEMLKSGHAGRWLELTDSARPTWSTVFDRYRATTDWPAAYYWRELADAYPRAKLILTVRDADEWYDSFESTLLSLRRAMPDRWPGLRAIAKICDRAIWDGEFDGRAQDRSFAIAQFQAHIDHVKRRVPRERLLIFNVREGWQPLCEFLGVPIPEDLTFPRSNERRSIRRLVWLARTARYAVPILVIAFAVAGAALLIAI